MNGYIEMLGGIQAVISGYGVHIIDVYNGAYLRLYWPTGALMHFEWCGSRKAAQKRAQAILGE
jgi:hypothetical protein